MPLVHDSEDRVVLSVGTLDDPFDRQIARHIFVGSKAPWWNIDDDLPQFEEHAPASES